MKTESFEKSNLDWQLRQLSQNFSEWWELQRSKVFGRLANTPFPTLENPEFWAKFIADSLLFLLLALIIGILWQTRQYWLRYLQQWRSFSLPTFSPTATVSVNDWLRRSQSYQQKGDYYQACRCLYLGMLQHLHDQNLIPRLESRTDEEYRLLVLDLPEPDPYETLLIIHEQLCFAQQTASPHLYQRCQQAFQQILTTLTPT
ncbi:MAG: DUF4129 domain-containing protein [Microcystaceae cyanobacterium]